MLQDPNTDAATKARLKEAILVGSPETQGDIPGVPTTDIPYLPGVSHMQMMKQLAEQASKAVPDSQQSDAAKTLAATVGKITATAKIHAENIRLAAGHAVANANAMHAHAAPLGSSPGHVARVEARHEQHIYVHGNDSPSATAAAVQTAQNAANTQFANSLKRKVAA